MIAWVLAGELTWEAPEGCPDAAFVRERVAAYVGDDAGPFSASVRVQRVGKEHIAEVEVAAEVGTNARTLQASDCTTLANAAALVIAVDVDVLAAASSPAVRRVTENEPDPVLEAPTVPPLEPPEPPAAAPEEPEPVASVAPRERTTSAPQRRLPKDLGFGVRFDAGLGLLALPSINLLAGLTAAIRWKRWRWELGAAHHFERPARLDPQRRARHRDRLGDHRGRRPLGLARCRGCPHALRCRRRISTRRDPQGSPGDRHRGRREDQAGRTRANREGHANGDVPRRPRLRAKSRPDHIARSLRRTRLRRIASSAGIGSRLLHPRTWTRSGGRTSTVSTRRPPARTLHSEHSPRSARSTWVATQPGRSESPRGRAHGSERRSRFSRSLIHARRSPALWRVSLRCTRATWGLPPV